jgi:hypothetical protein
MGGRIILKKILEKKIGGKICSGFRWLRRGSRAGLL